MTRPKTHHWLQLFFLVALTAAVTAAFRRYGLPHCDRLHLAIHSFGNYAPLGYIALSIAASLILFPRTPLVIAAGMVFGIPYAAALDLLASGLGASAGFLLARYLARPAVELQVQKSGILTRHPLLAGLLEETKEHGLSFVLFIRIVHFFPFGPMNYLCGVLPIRYLNYLFGTLLGLIPGTLALAYSGDTFGCAILDGRASLPHAVKVKMAAGMIILMVLSVLPILLGRRHAKRRRGTRPGNPG